MHVYLYENCYADERKVFSDLNSAKKFLKSHEDGPYKLTRWDSTKWVDENDDDIRVYKLKLEETL